ncbi:alpha-ketoglutarate decarboxylase [Schaalia meyeri]|uniref:multifunctional oxoglutarate decarboxylase/oxoglutarate dehydrogenase thiamine pyrophosphate-binding subunit/dihydrolipoyllysine-residue succinyltransferase subunit n=1 Tax=Schaalia meyeri TaxID=52773 RepID=UPI00067F9A65|nr:multifunctional oxoglutarate decarboxylase/oxoglutarate dehydrogenase thiamine pyrophosphate-binding subunit/dihydrolipoyllysine-residue succinyltransferase subunit [Schaalia meyeri]AKU65201.1 alpha-ketoglutarate decarboxylase [Schaalia meyeri]
MPTHTASQPDPRWYIAKMRDLYDRDPQLLDPSWRAYFSTESAPPQLRAARPPIPGAAPATPRAATALARDASVPAHPTTPGGRDAHLTATPPTLDIEEDADAPAYFAPIISVTRSDLPPAPPVALAEATSPYTRQQHGRAAFTRSHDAPSQDEIRVLKSSGRATAKHMEASLSIPTATSQRQIPAKLLIENRALINAHLARTVGGKVSFTHLIGYALVEALCEIPDLNVRYTLEAGKPAAQNLAHIGLGLAIDVADASGNHFLKVPVIHDADTLTFSEFVDAYQDLVSRARAATLTTADFQGASVTLTNPGTLGTTTSVPRLMAGQGLIVGVGATDYPAEFRGVSPKRLASLGIGKTMCLSSTYDHRIIQGAASGRLLGLVDAKLSGRDGFYERVFTSLHVPTRPYSWEADYEYDQSRDKGKPARIAEIIHAYRSRGHLAADTDPLAYRVRQHPDLDISSYGLSVWDLDRPFPTGGFGGADQMLLRDILTRLHDTYTRTVGIEYMHIQDPSQRAWVQKRIEGPYEAPSPAAQRHILDTLIRAEAFEEFLQTKFVGQKRFSLEGGESLIPLLDHILADSARTGIHEVAIGMAHRGRLNVLANIAGKSYAQIFDEFEGNYVPNSVQGSGDVKYHLGTWGVYSLDDGLATKVYMGANPSHLEAADGVLEGIVRAKQEHLGDPDLPIIPILIHGDAAFVGQGVVQETLNLSQLEGYKTGGTIHVIVNNQIGFTTGPAQGRSTGYATDLAKGLQIPILHVNADDPEAVVRCAHLAFEYRNAFHKDVIIDMLCYRRRGHNEGDDPSMTQPVMYSLINRIPSTRAVYIRGLVGRGQLTEDEARQSIARYEAELGRILEETRAGGAGAASRVNPGSRTHDPALTAGVGQAGESPNEQWTMPESQLPGTGMMIGWTSAAPEEQLQRIGRAHTRFPEGFHPHPKLRQLCERRHDMSLGRRPIDWGFAELLAFGTLLMEGTGVRLSGEDVGRATFVQRHAILHDATDGREFTPLRFLTQSQARFDVWNSPLSECGVLAFDYGYSLESPETLTVWEAQFGDFANGAQTVIDEFVCSAEQKWGQRSSLVMLLPHGHEGQGPDHSSARIERYLQLAAQDNMWIVQPSTPANYFHMLRTQAYKRPRKPLIAFTPKQLLRLSAAASPIDEFTSGAFQPVIGDVANPDPASVTRLLMCSGRLYYDLAHERDRLADSSTAIIRLEQLYPLPKTEIASVLGQYPHACLAWVQDEPCNQGAWPHLALNLFPSLERPVRLVSRPESATTAAGRASLHKQQAATLIAQAFEG